jgi:phage FluMu gp28-like protein
LIIRNPKFEIRNHPEVPMTQTSDPTPPDIDLLACSARVLNLLPYQRRAIESTSRFTWNCWARQTGKSFTFALRRLFRAIQRRRDQIILSAGERQSREVMQKVRNLCELLNMASQLLETPCLADPTIRQLEITLPNKARIIGLPANPLTARGYSGDVFLDEFAMHREDEAIWNAMFPTLLREGGELDVASTPRGCRNVFHRLRGNEEFSHSRLTLEEAIGQGLAADAEAMRRGIGDEIAWRQEFCCEFLDEATSFMPYELIRACQDARLITVVDWKAIARERADIFAGVDVGRVRDVTCVWLWELVPPSQVVRRGETSKCPNVETSKQNHADAGRYIIAGQCENSPSGRDAGRCKGTAGEGVPARRDYNGDVLITRGVVVLEGATFREQEARIVEILEQRNVRKCCVDATGLGMQLAEGLVERFGDYRVESIMFTAALKNELAGRLRVRAERGQLRIPVDERIERDWHSISRVCDGGAVRYEADRSSGGHGDRFWAAALAAHAAREGSSHIEIGYISVEKRRFARTGIW